MKKQILCKECKVGLIVALDEETNQFHLHCPDCKSIWSFSQKLNNLFDKKTMALYEG